MLRKHAASHRAVALASAVVLAAALAACSSGSSPSHGATGASVHAQSSAAKSETGSSTAPSTSASDAQTNASLAAAAAAEGKVTWYSAYPAAIVPKVVAAFNKQYPKIKVNPLRLGTSDLVARLDTEAKAGKHDADVVQGDATEIFELEAQGLLSPYTPPDAAPLPPGINLPAGYRNIDSLNTAVIAYNPTVLKKLNLTPPTSWQELTKPEWKGKFSVDPKAISWYEGLIESMGHAKALDLAKQLGKNSPRIVNSERLSAVDAEAGDPPVAAMTYGYEAGPLSKQNPETLAFVNPVPLPTGLDVIELVKGAPHPNAAKLFLDWFVSQPGQHALVAASGHPSVRPDVTNNPPTEWNPAKWPPAWADPTIPEATYNMDVNELKQAFGTQ